MWTDALAARGPLLLLLDFDGTLVPIAEHPDAIEVPVELPRLLAGLGAAGHAVYIVTGRRGEFVRERLGDGVPIIGLHGLEWPGEPVPARHPALDLLSERASEALVREPALEGALIEDKGLSLALHYRGATARERAHERLLALAESAIFGRSELNVLDGHCVVEVRPREASKANAVRRLVEKYPDRTPIFMGDDVTDEEAFAALGPLGLGVRVGTQPVVTRAQLSVRDVPEVLRGLERLGRARPLAGPQGPP